MACIGHVLNECTDRICFLLTLCSSVSSMFLPNHRRRACVSVDTGCHHFLGSVPPKSMVVVCAFAKKSTSNRCQVRSSAYLRQYLEMYVCLAFKGIKSFFFFLFFKIPIVIISCISALK